MEIFGVGLPELILIAVVALIVLGPDRLPEAARAAGRAVRELRQAVEPARSAWSELSSELSGVSQQVPASGRATIKPARPGEKTTAIPTDNPWKIHPITEGMTDEEREHFMATGVIPEHILAELDAKRTAAESSNGATWAEPAALSYPAPHETGPGATPQAEDLSYPAPSPAKRPTSRDDAAT